MRTTKEHGSKVATSFIMRRKVTKADVLSLALELQGLEALEGATDAFHRQGPRLWGFWCTAMKARVKSGLPVPKVFQ